MGSQFARVALYRFRVTFARRWPGYLSVVLLIGLMGGLSMASISAGRRTQSSYPTFMASTNPSDLTFSGNTQMGDPIGTAPFDRKLSGLPDVRHFASLLGPEVIPLGRGGKPRLNLTEQITVAGSLNGMLSRLDRVTAVEGRLADPRRSDEIVLDTRAAQLLGVSVGDSVPLGFFTNAQEQSTGFGSATARPKFRVMARVVGIVELNDQVLQDDIDRTYGFMILTPALLRRAIAISPVVSSAILFGVQLDHGDRDIAKVEKELIKILPTGSTYQFHVTSHNVAAVELSLKPESLALGSFGAIAAFICLVLAAQALSRQLRRGEEDRRVMRALGARPFDVVIEGLIGPIGAVVLGAMVAVVLAVALSPLAPLGPVRRVYPDGGVAVDWTVLGFGFLILILVLGATTVVASVRRAPHRDARRRDSTPGRSRILKASESSGVPIAATMGVHFALEPGHGRREYPVRSVLSGSVLAVALVVATTTFSSGFNSLISHPALYGWNWSYVLNPSTDIPPKAVSLLDHDPDVQAWSGAELANAQIDGQTIPMLIANTRLKVAPPILTGHGVDAKNQIVLGAATMALLHKKLGDTVVATYGTAADAPIYVPPTPLVIVGTATFPAVGYTSFVADHTSMGTGALLPWAILPRAFRKALKNPDPNLNGPEMAFVRLKPNISAAAGRANLQHIANFADEVFASDPHGQGNLVSVLGVQRPAQIVNYRSIGSTPVVLSLGLAIGAIFALGLTLIASVRRRRRDLALLKALGFTQRQLAQSVAWQAATIAAFGVIVGVPLGILSGRELWILFAQSLNAVPYATVPVATVALIGLGALVFAVVLSAIPGRSAARTSSALVLHSE
jgi:FtsX-like permease family